MCLSSAVDANEVRAYFVKVRPPALRAIWSDARRRTRQVDDSEADESLAGDCPFRIGEEKWLRCRLKTTGCALSCRVTSTAVKHPLQQRRETFGFGAMQDARHRR